jgi:amidase
MAMDPKHFKPVTTTAEELQHLLRKGELTSVQIVSQYLHQIEKHNSNGANLKAMISLVPKSKLLTIAAAHDTERARGKVRSVLHGIPIVLKVKAALVAVEYR